MAKKKEKYIYEKENGAYVVTVAWTDTQGKRHTKQIGTYNPKKYNGSKAAALKAAKAARDQAMVDIRLEKINDSRYTVQRLFDESQERCASVKTRKNHESIYSRLIPEDLRDKEIEKVTLKEIQGTIDGFAIRHSQDAVNRTPAIWHAIYKQAFINEIYVPDRSQAILVPKSKVPISRRAKHVGMDDLETFMDALLSYNPDQEDAKAVNKDIWDAMRVMQYCGLRPQEAFALAVNDIDLDHGLLHVRHSVGTTQTEYRQIIPTKTEKSEREIPIPEELEPILKERIEEREDGLLFVAKDGLPYEIDYVSGYVYRVSKKAGVKVTLYMLRHKFATDVARATDAEMARSLMGHESTVMTNGYRAEPTEEEKREALKKRKMS